MKPSVMLLFIAWLYTGYILSEEWKKNKELTKEIKECQEINTTNLQIIDSLSKPIKNGPNNR